MLCTVGVVKLMLIQHLVGVSSLMSSVSTAIGRRHTDNLLIARCRSKCTSTNDKMTCESSCIQDYLENSSYKKYGDCPKDPLNRLEAICQNTCQSTDYHCPGIEKCCSHSCGMSCQAPIGLEKVRGLPPVPFHVVLREAGRSFRMAEIQWEITLEEEMSSAIYFVIESRHHIGISFAERKLENDWQNHTPTVIYEVKRAGNQKRYVGEMKLKPGRWYQVRVAAVNELGTKGYSVVSKEFQLSKKPQPPQPPKNFTLGQLVLNANGTYNRKITWTLPRSDLPVEKYKISWSLYLNASAGPKAGNSSLFKETATVSAPSRHFEIKGLQPNSIYYLQIHAISVYGKRRLKSAATSELMDTTVDTDEAARPPNMDNMLMNDASFQRRTKSGSSAQGLNYKFVPRKSGLVVRVTWPDKNPTGRYRLHLCQGARDCLTKPMGANFHDVIVKQRTSYEFARLDFETKYTVGLRHNRKRAVTQQQHDRIHHQPGGYDSVRTFVTPKCDHFRKAHPELQLDCAV
ncbi:anosmin-1 isoform X2 [Toxorhynchites rutilus septentrionalis]|uniref:anosmin-1 isoform X2 n=1 Tax=Toxorhynchites rutilus septentrionalis TaxID=329112 RepID=UPI00247A2E82|nr:anosmin-1 isoform X2 [Toxorhynchites rutilus septentrionalis]